MENSIGLQFNPFKPNGYSHSYHMHQSISFLLRVIGVGFFFHFYSNVNRIFCKQAVETLIRRHIQRRLIWVCIVCIIKSHKKDARHIWVNKGLRQPCRALTRMPTYLEVFFEGYCNFTITCLSCVVDWLIV